MARAHPHLAPESLLVVMALAEEAGACFDDVPVLFTGVGKVNAAYRLTRELCRRASSGAPALVLNFGTAGSPHHPIGSLLQCTRFFQRDMDLTGLGFEAGTTPFESVPAELAPPSLEPFLEPLPGCTPGQRCASADRFETLSHTLAFDAVEMEAYALAKVCHLEGLPFACVKYVSDSADEEAAGDWHSSLPRAARAFRSVYDQLTRSEG